MQPAQNATVFIVDDDSGVRDALAWLLRSRHLPSEVFASGKRYSDALNTQKLGGYGLVNLFAHYQVDRNWRLEARVNNLFDKDYELAKGYNTLGTGVFVGVRYTSR